jgi:hypothetical protein
MSLSVNKCRNAQARCSTRGMLSNSAKRCVRSVLLGSLGRRSFAGGPVEQLAGGVGVASVTGGLVDQVQQHPAQVTLATAQARLGQRCASDVRVGAGRRAR